MAALRMSRGDKLLVSSCTPPLVLSMHWHWLSLPAVRCGGMATVGVVPDPCRARALLSATLLSVSAHAGMLWLRWLHCLGVDT